MYYGYGIGGAGYYLAALALMVLSMVVSGMVKGRYNRYRGVAATYTGAQAAERILRANGLTDVEIRPVSGTLTDNYNPMNRTLNLSDDVYNSNSVSAVCVAAHECGHAIQHAQNYFPLMIRKSIVPVANVCSSISYVLILLGMFLQSFGFLIDLGVILFSVVVLVHIVTLPVELNASRRALAQVRDLGIIRDDDDLAKGRKVLTAAACTYFVSLLSALVQLLRLVNIARRRK
ncbi:MAG: zinc metallopeptidase [Oscillospiraceae bacterium]|nr:zinc metallopeptidase [Oscillospiraceae bacterium]